MTRAIALALMALSSLLGCHGNSASRTAAISQPIGERTLRFTIETLADCELINDYPYARNLFCPAAFSAAQTMLDALAERTDRGGPTRGVFYYYQTRADPEAPPDRQSQTTVGCQDIRAPWSGSTVVGAGVPLCRLIAYATSPGPTEPVGVRRDNPVPDELRAFPAYFSRLYAPQGPALLEFGNGGAFDSLVRNLGASARDAFLRDYPSFSPKELYDPAGWRRDPQYRGISGGGGGGWGAEISVAGADAAPRVLLAFGGGGGAGMTSARGERGAVSTVGGGGGGGMQLADGYRDDDRAFNGLGLGAGVGSDEVRVQYSYFDADGSQRFVQPVHDYNRAVIEEFRAQLGHVVQQLTAARAAGATVILRGGGGMGAGVEYLSEGGAELEPHALSTQAGFQFRYAFAAHDSNLSAQSGPGEQEDDQGAFAQVGEAYREATERAYERCGRDYADYACMCPTTHAIVVCRIGRELGDVAKLPVWLQQQHCPDNAIELAQAGDTRARCDDLLREDAATARAATVESSGMDAPLCEDLQRSTSDGGGLTTLR